MNNDLVTIQDLHVTLGGKPILRGVDANLARVYRKLGIHSRAELGAKLGSPD